MYHSDYHDVFSTLLIIIKSYISTLLIMMIHLSLRGIWSKRHMDMEEDSMHGLITVGETLREKLQPTPVLAVRNCRG